MSKTRDELTRRRLAELTAVPFLAADCLATIARMIAAVQPSGVEGAALACRRLRRIKAALSATVARLDDATTELVRRVEGGR